MHERIHLDRTFRYFIAMPGGLGTLEELFEMFTLAATLEPTTSCFGLLNVNAYYDHLFAILEQVVVGAGFLKAGAQMALVDQRD